MRAFSTIITAIAALVLVIVPTANAAAAPNSGAARSVTLITGDRVVLAGDKAGPVVRPAAGREQVPVVQFRDNGHLFVVPPMPGG